jgi:Tfp pilus assembly protein PilV
MKRGFTLIEILISTGILLTGIVAVASVFAYTVTANLDTQQRTTAQAILYDKVETFRSTSITDSIWSPGGSLTPQSPINGYLDYVAITTSGIITTSTTNSHLPFMRIWEISGNDPRMVTVIAYAQRAGVTRRRPELVRATVVVGSRF